MYQALALNDVIGLCVIKYGIALPPPASPSVELDNGAIGGNGGNTDLNNDSDEDDDVVF